MKQVCFLIFFFWFLNSCIEEKKRELVVTDDKVVLNGNKITFKNITDTSFMFMVIGESGPDTTIYYEENSDGFYYKTSTYGFRNNGIVYILENNNRKLSGSLVVKLDSICFKILGKVPLEDFQIFNGETFLGISWMKNYKAGKNLVNEDISYYPGNGGGILDNEKYSMGISKSCNNRIGMLYIDFKE